MIIRDRDQLIVSVATHKLSVAGVAVQKILKRNFLMKSCQYNGRSPTIYLEDENHFCIRFRISCPKRLYRYPIRR